MSRSGLTPFSYVVLVLVGRDGAGPHDLMRMARLGRVYISFADSQWYAEPKRLAQLGYLSSQKEPGKTRERTHYSLTRKGRDALAAWMREPSGFSRLQLEPAWRLLAADLVGEQAVVASLASLRGEIADLNAQIDTGEAVADRIPAPGTLPAAQPSTGTAHREGARGLARRGGARARDRQRGRRAADGSVDACAPPSSSHTGNRAGRRRWRCSSAPRSTCGCRRPSRSAPTTSPRYSSRPPSSC